MAKPIRNTPVLRGRDAMTFHTEISNLPAPAERKRERDRIAASVNTLKSLIESLPQ